MTPRQNEAVGQARPVNGERPRLGGKLLVPVQVVPPFVVYTTKESTPSPASQTVYEEQAISSKA
jgi:hypothetical protein